MMGIVVFANIMNNYLKNQRKAKDNILCITNMTTYLKTVLSN